MPLKSSTKGEPSNDTDDREDDSDLEVHTVRNEDTEQRKDQNLCRLIDDEPDCRVCHRLEQRHLVGLFNYDAHLLSSACVRVHSCDALLDDEGDNVQSAFDLTRVSFRNQACHFPNANVTIQRLLFSKVTMSACVHDDGPLL